MVNENRPTLSMGLGDDMRVNVKASRLLCKTVTGTELDVVSFKFLMLTNSVGKH